MRLTSLLGAALLTAWSQIGHAKNETQPLTQANLIGALQLKQGGWKTGLIIEDAKMTAHDKKTAPPDQLAKLKAMTGLRQEARDCIGALTEKPGDIILPGLSLSDIAESNWSAKDGTLTIKATIGYPSDIRSFVDVTSRYSPEQMATTVFTRVEAKWGVMEMRLKVDSVYEGECQFTP